MRVAVVGVADFTSSFVRRLLEQGHEVVVFDDVKEGIERLEAELDVAGAAVDLLDFDQLESFGFSKADVLLLAHRDESVNMVLSIYAKVVNIPRVLVVSRSRRMAEALLRLGLASSVILVSEVLERAVSSALRGAELVELPGGHVVAVLDTRVVGQLVGASAADLKERCKPSALRVVDREGALREPPDDYVIKEGDTLVLIAEKRAVEELLTS